MLEHVRTLCESNDYDFLREKPEDGYHDHVGFIEQVRERWLDRVDREFRECTGLVEETQYIELFDRYVTHVSYWVKNERVYNRVTGGYEDPDEKLMANVESMLEIEASTRHAFRRDLISAVAGHAIDNPGVQVNYAKVFPRYLAKLKEATYSKRKKQLSTIAKDLLIVLSEDEAAIGALGRERAQQARATLARMKERYGYADSSARDAIGELFRKRLAD